MNPVKRCEYCGATCFEDEGRIVGGDRKFQCQRCEADPERWCRLLDTPLPEWVGSLRGLAEMVERNPGWMRRVELRGMVRRMLRRYVAEAEAYLRVGPPRQGSK